MPKGNENQELVRLHREEFCRSFLVPNRRDRMLAKPAELAHEFYHNLPRWLRPNRHSRLGPPVTSEGLKALIRSLNAHEPAVYLGHGLEEGPHTIDRILEELCCDHRGVASFEPGEIALYATEGCPRADWYLLCADSDRLNRAAAWWSRAKTARGG